MNYNSNKKDSQEGQEQEVPELTRDHLDELAKGSGISVDVIKERGYKTIWGIKELQSLGFTKSQRQKFMTPGILMPVHPPDGSNSLHQYKPDHPRKNEKDKPIKYETPGNQGLRIDCPPRCREQLKDPHIPLIITEGIKKADALASRGACVIDLLGVWGYKGKNEFGAPTISIDIDYIAWQGRTVYIIYDSDIMEKEQVQAALKRLTELLQRKGATVLHIYLQSSDGKKKVGADDYLLEHSIEELLSHAVEPGNASKIKEEVGNIYSFDDMGYLCRTKFTQTGLIKVRLCNFDAKVREVVRRDNGLETPTQYYKIEATTKTKNLGTVVIPSTSFNAMNWVAHLDYEAIIEPGAGSQDYVRHFIKTSSSPTSTTVYTHTGWRKRDNDWVYLSSNGALGAEDFNVELEPELSRYALPSKPENEAKAIKASISFLELAPKKITLPLLSTLYLSPLTTIISPMPNFSLYLWGPTQGFKTTLGLLMCSHFGNFDDQKQLSNFYDTANALMKRSFTLKDILFPVDDFHPSAQKAEAQKKAEIAQRLLRSFANRTERGRLNPDMSERPRYEPRGMLLVTGEDLVSVQSTLARALIVELAKGEVDREKLSALQAIAHLLPHAMASYLLWLRLQLDEIAKGFRQEFIKWRTQGWEEGLSGKPPEQVAFLYFAFNTTLNWAQDKGVLSDSRAKEMAKEGWETFLEIARAQARMQVDEDPTNKFKNLLNTLIAQGKVKIKNKEQTDDQWVDVLGSTEGEMIGFYDETFFWLMPDAVWNVIQRACISAGDYFSVTQRTLYKMLKDRQMIQPGKNTNTTPATIHGKSYNILKLYRAKMTEPGEEL